MEFDIRKRRPHSVQDLLLDQLTHNTDLCDVTVKHGFWEKKYHWCVLVGSPYFACIRRFGYQERESGVISLVIGSPAALEEGLLFLYGKPLNISAENIEALFEVAEYLLLPDLKAECVRWIKRQPLTDNNCLSWLKLSNIYEFPWQSCENFVSGLLPKLMKEDSFLDVTESAVLHILTDPLLSYVETCDKFEFLVNWAKYRTNRVHKFEKLLDYINFEDVDQSFITNVVMEENLIYELDDVTAILKRLRSPRRILTTCDVLLFPNSFTDDKLACFDITRKQWCSVAIKYIQLLRMFCRFDNEMVQDIECIHGNDLYSLTRRNSELNPPNDLLHIWNLESETLKDINILLSKPTIHAKHPEQWKPKFCIHNNKLILVSKEDSGYTRKKGGPVTFDELQTQILDIRIVDRPTINSECSTVYIGEIEGDGIFLLPVLINLNGDMSHICANRSNLALLSNSSDLLYLYSLEDSTLERFSLSAIGQGVDKDDVLAPAGSGFVIYNNTTITNIEERPVPTPKSKFLINQYKLPPRKHDEGHTEYRVCDNTWYRYSCNEAGQSTFGCTTHAMFMSLVESLAENPSCAHAEIWDTLPAHTRPGKELFKVTLSKDRLTCIVDCPHCNPYSGGYDDDFYCDFDDYYDSDYQVYGSRRSSFGSCYFNDD